ncbi:MAG TPA: hypothetical protein VL126_06805, partial [Bacteroidota bacterium]|nr:hypothetical protein [Bacteroidota bacterium]
MRKTLFALTLASASVAPGQPLVQWESTGGPFAQNISTVLPDCKTPGSLYVGLHDGEIVFSSNEGRSWSHHSALPRVHRIFQILQDPDLPERFYAATDMGAFSSNDRARQWSPLLIGAPGTPVRALCLDPWTPGVMYAGTVGRGIFKTNDGGKTWHDINTSTEERLASADIFDIALDLAKPDVIYAAVSSLGIFRTTDGGKNWVCITEEPSIGGARATHLLLQRGGKGALLFGTSTGAVMKSTNAGASWSPSRNSRGYDRIVSLCGHAGNPDLVFAGTEEGVFVSSDFGGGWRPCGRDLPKLATHIAIGPPIPQAALYAYGNGIGLQASSDNGESWHEADFRLGGSTIEVMATDPSGEHFLAAAGSVALVYNSANPSQWTGAGTGITGGLISSLSPDPELAGTFYATTPGGVFQTTDGGLTWEPVAKALQISPTLFAVHPSIRTREFAATEQGLFVSTDRGKTWSEPRPRGSRWHIDALTFSSTNAGTILASTENSSLIITHDGGFVWEGAHYGIPAERIEA